MKTNKRKLESTETTLKKVFRMLSSVGKNGRLETPKGTKGQEISHHRKPLNIRIASHLEKTEIEGDSIVGVISNENLISSYRCISLISVQRKRIGNSK